MSTLVSTPAALGLRSKTGKAILVALAGPLASPQLLSRREIGLTVPDVPASVQPYHEVMDLQWDQAVTAAQVTEALIEIQAADHLREVLLDLGRQGHTVVAIGVVGSSDRDLTRIGNRHIRTHAAEGLLFRRVLECAASRNDVPFCGFADRSIDALVQTSLSWSKQRLDQALLALGRSAGPPWRADERLAAMAALLALHGAPAVAV